MMDYFDIPKWREYQHYNNRNPPWIKLHFSILSSPDWVMLADASRVLAIACMLIASRNEGKVPNDPKYLQRVAYLSEPPDFQPLIDCGFLDASNCKQMLADARPETETEKRREYSSEPNKFDSEPKPTNQPDLFNQEQPKPASKPIKVYFTFPVVGTPNTWDVTSTELNAWNRVYGEVCDVYKEVQKAKLWWDANPSKRKTAKGMLRFFNNWFTTAVNSGRCARPQEKAPEELDTCHLTHEEIQASFALAEKQRQAAIEAGLCDEKGDLIIPEYEDLKRYKAELEADRASN
jgi:hypothetical protein